MRLLVSDSEVLLRDATYPHDVPFDTLTILTVLFRLETQSLHGASRVRRSPSLTSISRTASTRPGAFTTSLARRRKLNGQVLSDEGHALRSFRASAIFAELSVLVLGNVAGGS